MDQDDPEKRIAELEAQLANATAAAGPPPRPLTADDVRNTVFAKPPNGERGYNEDDVDALLDRIELHLRNPQALGGLTAAEIDSATFAKPPIGQQGYDEVEVDAFLDRVVQQLPPGVTAQAATPAAANDGGWRRRLHRWFGSG
jgi:DivIVA domain-containing protein